MRSAKKEVLWRALAEPGMEHLSLSWNKTAIQADGWIKGPFRLQYHIKMDTAWNVQTVAIRVTDSQQRDLILKSDTKGNWADPKGFSFPELEGSIDVDLNITPFTNTIPIRRLKLQKGQSAELQVAYIDASSLQLSLVPQRYTCLDQSPGGGLYRYEGLSTGFQAELQVDELGLVINYPGLWERVG